MPCKGVGVRVFIDLIVHIPYLVLLLPAFLGSNLMFYALHGQMSVKVAFKTFSRDNHPLLPAFHSFSIIFTFFGMHFGTHRKGVTNTHLCIKITLFKSIRIPEQSQGKKDCVQDGLSSSMALHPNIIGDWFSKQSSLKRTSLLKRIALSLALQESPSVEQMTSTLAAGLLAACAEDMGLSTVELAGLLRNPRKDAIAGLVTVLRDAR